MLQCSNTLTWLGLATRGFKPSADAGISKKPVCWQFLDEMVKFFANKFDSRAKSLA
jgi:hypothetical protein